MFKLLFLAAIVVSTSVFPVDLPKDAYGQYSGEVATYSVIKNDIEMKVEQHDVHLTITEDLVIYKSGSMVLSGAYECMKQSNGEYLVKTSVSNGKSLTFDLEMTVNKRKDTLVINGKNGEPDVNCEKLDN